MSANDIELKVKVMDGNDLVVKCELGDTVEMLKKRIEKETNIPVNEQKLIYRGRMLTNDKTLSESSLEDHCAIFLVKQKVYCMYYPFTHSQERMNLNQKQALKPLQRLMCLLSYLFIVGYAKH